MNPGGLRIMVTAWGVASGLAMSTWSPASPIVTYNATASAPMGFYRLEHASRIGVGDYVLSHLPPDAARLADHRRYVPASVPVLKRVAAGPGASVCRSGARLLVEGRAVARALTRDHAGRPLPAWSGCRVLGHGQVFLLSTRNPASFDGRYFGPTSAALIIAKAHPLWTW